MKNIVTTGYETNDINLYCQMYSMLLQSGGI